MGKQQAHLLQNGRQQPQLQLPLRLQGATLCWRPNRRMARQRTMRFGSPKAYHVSFIQSIAIPSGFSVGSRFVIFCDFICIPLSISNRVPDCIHCSCCDLPYDRGIVGALKLQARKDWKSWEEASLLNFDPWGSEVLCKLVFSIFQSYGPVSKLNLTIELCWTCRSKSRKTSKGQSQASELPEAEEDAESTMVKSPPKKKRKEKGEKGPKDKDCPKSMSITAFTKPAKTKKWGSESSLRALDLPTCPRTILPWNWKRAI